MSEYAEKLRAERAERALNEATLKLGRILEMADAWERTFGDDGSIAVETAVEVIRQTVEE